MILKNRSKNSASKVKEINAPTIEKKLIPNNNGHKDIITFINNTILVTVIKLRLPVMQYTPKKIRIIQVINAVINGAKLAYPKGTKSK